MQRYFFKFDYKGLPYVEFIDAVNTETVPFVRVIFRLQIYIQIIKGKNTKITNNCEISWKSHSFYVKKDGVKQPILLFSQPIESGSTIIFVKSQIKRTNPLSQNR